MQANSHLIPLVAGTVIDTLESAATGAELISKALRPRPGSHTKLAKDSPRAQGFAMAHQLATAADQRIFFWVHRVMQESSADKAQKDTYILFKFVDAILTVPSDNHPLKDVYQAASAKTGSTP